jgi:A1 cistron-splicing factor AAR2
MMEDGEEVELEMAELQAEDERGEWAPEVVQLDEQGRQTDLISWDD